MWKRPTFDPTACLQARRRSGSVSLILFSTPSRQRRNEFSTFCEGVFHSTIKISNGISSQKSNSLHACSQLKSLSILQTKLPGKGCIRSPVAHCKLNPIELVWFNLTSNDTQQSIVKHINCQTSINCYLQSFKQNYRTHCDHVLKEEERERERRDKRRLA